MTSSMSPNANLMSIFVLYITGCPHSHLLGVNGLASAANRLLLLGTLLRPLEHVFP